MSRAGRAALALALLGLLAGCAQLAQKPQMLRLEDALNAYASALRWGHLNTANSYLRARDGGSLATRASLREDLRVTRYRVTGRAPLAEGEVLVEARLSYMSSATGTVRETTDRQVWWYDGDERRWFLEGQIPPVLLDAP